MIVVFVALIRVVYGRTINMSLPSSANLSTGRGYPIQYIQGANKVRRY